MPFNTDGIFSELGYLERLIEYAGLAIFFDGRGGSSSSLLNVKSIICPIGLLALLEAVITECSLEDPGGVLEIELISPLTAAIRGIFLISWRSSSSSLLARSPPPFGEALESVVWYSPLGSMMT